MVQLRTRLPGPEVWGHPCHPRSSEAPGNMRCSEWWSVVHAHSRHFYLPSATVSKYLRNSTLVISAGIDGYVAA